MHTVHRYKRPPKRKEAVALKVGRIAQPKTSSTFAEPTPTKVRTSAIVTAKRKPSRFGGVPDMTAEEHQRRGDASEALWQELVRRATGKS